MKCSTHPKYKVKRAPTSGCIVCEQLFQDKQKQLIEEDFQQAQTIEEQNKSIKLLKKLAPVGAEVEVVRQELEGCLATCNYITSRNVFVITLDPDIDPSYFELVLAHEWAHAMSWFVDGATARALVKKQFTFVPGAFHTAMFGVAYATCYNILVLNKAEIKEIKHERIKNTRLVENAQKKIRRKQPRKPRRDRK